MTTSWLRGAVAAGPEPRPGLKKHWTREMGWEQKEMRLSGFETWQRVEKCSRGAWREVDSIRDVAAGYKMSLRAQERGSRWKQCDRENSEVGI